MHHYLCIIASIVRTPDTPNTVHRLPSRFTVLLSSYLSSTCCLAPHPSLCRRCSSSLVYHSPPPLFLVANSRSGPRLRAKYSRHSQSLMLKPSREDEGRRERKEAEGGRKEETAAGMRRASTLALATIFLTYPHFWTHPVSHPLHDTTIYLC